jgi:hypothetical protein
VFVPRIARDPSSVGPENTGGIQAASQPMVATGPRYGPNRRAPTIGNPACIMSRLHLLNVRPRHRTEFLLQIAYDCYIVNTAGSERSKTGARSYRCTIARVLNLPCVGAAVIREGGFSAVTVQVSRTRLVAFLSAAVFLVRTVGMMMGPLLVALAAAFDTSVVVCYIIPVDRARVSPVGVSVLPAHLPPADH